MKLFNFKKLTGYFAGEINVRRDWKLVLGGFVLFLIIIFSIDGYTSWKSQKELSGQVEGEVKFETVSRASLQKVIDGLNIKERKFNENLTAPAINDPSL
ncbi:MAG: hypothetical protein NTX55_02720 [Candidatus Parcubacteria bacterium]|nr:hypothetical protein [Candidatus Parcubacteria bacterium]